MSRSMDWYCNTLYYRYVLALVLESPFVDLIVGNLVYTSIPKPVENRIAIQNSNELTFSNYLGEKSTELTECPCSAVHTRKQRAKELKEVEKEQASGKVYTNDTPVSETVEIRNPENTFHFVVDKSWLRHKQVVRAWIKWDL